MPPTRVTAAALGGRPALVVVAGSGEFLARKLADPRPRSRWPDHLAGRSLGRRGLDRRLCPRPADLAQDRELRMSPILVVKLGGSLLDWPEWPTRLIDWLATRPELHPVLVVGGGRFADVLRDLDPIHALGEAARTNWPSTSSTRLPTSPPPSCPARSSSTICEGSNRPTRQASSRSSPPGSSSSRRPPARPPAPRLDDDY